MRIGVVSDTHSNALPEQMLKDFKDVDFIVHAGDFCSPQDYEQFRELKEVKAVHGNMDELSIRKHLPRKQIFDCQNYHIGLFHGEGVAKAVLKTVQEEFRGEDVDVVIFGHSHQPLNKKIGNVLYFNPGSPNDTVFAPYCSYGILNISEKGITGEIIKVE